MGMPQFEDPLIPIHDGYVRVVILCSLFPAKGDIYIPFDIVVRVRLLVMVHAGCLLRNAVGFR
jgi:hypothetical protein